ncbi:Gfo/Idh/MocA family protein [Alkalicoccobacillus plakortidis]|uniref:Gfo/Idh/MocA family oxidoreductase n=1 Tax=Alkalicoccobacillus plakortidis TaxID=444060 RepID=A0ABT0XJR5_9BACI|nr:Gfo/Idh/MocA family oxidoreductase [Alkalicoccobacillus plakortidis]MCM2676144.1 Gfo/Idh/MocA family oxidoreductase [Alkalicoccobacillus plakortidis]
MKSDKQAEVVLIGINGYGESYLRLLLERTDASLIGVVEIAAEKSSFFGVLQERSIPIYKSIEAFYENHSADLAIISTPIHLHTKQAIYAMEQGSHVLCEKPLTGDPSDLPLWKKASEKNGKWAAVGFNWSFTESIQSLKKDIIAGVFGKAIQLKTLVLWPRTEDYFNRSTWAGKKYSPDGTLIMDSIANNATAHFLHNMFYMLGDRMETSAPVKDVEAQLYRVNEIETFDTCVVNMQTEKGTELLFLASHAVEKSEGPIFHYEFEKGVITFNSEDEQPSMRAEFHDGTKKDYGNPHVPHVDKLNWCLRAIHDSEATPPCDYSTAAVHVQVLGELNAQLDLVKEFPEELKRFDSATKLHYVENVREVLTDSYQKGTVPSQPF